MSPVVPRGHSSDGFESAAKMALRGESQHFRYLRQLYSAGDKAFGGFYLALKDITRDGDSGFPAEKLGKVVPLVACLFRDLVRSQPGVIV